MNPEIPAYGRWVALGLFVGSALGLIANHFMAETQQAVSLAILCLSPMGLFLGLGGTIEPKVVWALGKYGTHLPFTYKLIGGVLAGIGLVVTLILVVFVYPLWQ